MSKTDFKKELKDFYSAKKDKITVIKVPKMKFLAIDGMGDPETSQGFRMQSRRCMESPIRRSSA